MAHRIGYLTQLFHAQCRLSSSNIRILTTTTTGGGGGGGGGAGRRSFTSSSSSGAYESVISQPRNLKISPRSVSSPFYGLERVTQAAAIQADDQASERDVQAEYYSDEEEEEELEELLLYDLRSKPEPLRAIPLPDRLKVPVFDLNSAETVSQYDLPAGVFGMSPIRTDLIHRTVIYQRNKKRGKRFPAKTKTISEVRGSGKKMRQQKGSGMARMGHKRPPHFRGGAKAHGPKGIMQDYTTKLNKKVRKLGLKHALSQKLLEGNLLVVDSLSTESYHTNQLSKTLHQYGIGGKYGSTAFMVDGQDELDPNLRVAQQNIKKVKLVSQLGCNVYDILKKERLVLSKTAVEALASRL